MVAGKQALTLVEIYVARVHPFAQCRTCFKFTFFSCCVPLPKGKERKGKNGGRRQKKVKQVQKGTFEENKLERFSAHHFIIKKQLRFIIVIIIIIINASLAIITTKVSYSFFVHVSLLMDLFQESITISHCCITSISYFSINYC